MSALNSPDFPYAQVGADQRWDQAVGQAVAAGVLPELSRSPRFQLGPSTRVASAGSCFARHLAARLQASGFNYLLLEPPPPFLSPEAAAPYRHYSARYGEIYSSQQLLQLLQAALGEFKPAEPPWPHGPDQNGQTSWLDPLRPRVEPAGFYSPAEVALARQSHLQAVKQLFMQAEVFIFTLGLTEIWRCQQDGTVLPVCPGGRYGQFDPSRYRFENLSLAQNLTAMRQFLERLKALNPAVQVLLTVSPVPLAITLEPRHVLLSTQVSKATLRLCAEQLCQDYPWVDYFPAYELIHFAPEQHFEADRRHVSALGVERVMQQFFKHRVSAMPEPPTVSDSPLAAPASPAFPDPCDQDVLLELLDRHFEQP